MSRLTPKLPRRAARHLQQLLGDSAALPRALQNHIVTRSAGHTTHIWVINIFPGAVAPAESARVAAAARLDSMAAPVAAPLPPWTADTTGPQEAADADPLDTLSRLAVRTAIASHPAGSPCPAWAAMGLARWEFDSLRDVLGADTLGEQAAGRATDMPTAAASALLEWLWAYRTHNSPLTRAVCAAIACASMRPRHLWEELGLAGRDPLNRLLAGHLHALYRRNVTHMGWKKFILMQHASATMPGTEGLAAR